MLISYFKKGDKIMDLSIIIPMYNCQTTIERCLDSIFFCKSNSFEVILVNDGSTDHTAEIINKYTENVSLKYINKENGGVASARNCGLQYAMGKYIFFVDSDDYVDINNLLKALQWAEKNQLDILEVGYAVISNNKIRGTRTILNHSTFNNNKDDFQKILALLEPGYVWGKLFAKWLFDEKCIEFNQNLRFSEDLDFNLRAFKWVKRVGLYIDCCYYYVRAKNTLSAQFVTNLKYKNQVIGKAFDDLFLIYTEYKKKYLQNHIGYKQSNIINEIRNLYRNGAPYKRKERISIVRNIINSEKMMIFKKNNSLEGPKKYTEKVYCKIICSKNILIIDLFFYLLERYLT